jgi:H+/gluconate symporter-like permease
MNVAIRCCIAVLIAALATIAGFQFRWRRMKRQLVTEVEQHLRDVVVSAVPAPH